MTSYTKWNPNKVIFLRTNDNSIHEIESYNISLMEFDLRRDNILISHNNLYLKPVKIFNIQSFNRRIIKLSIIKTRITQSPLSEDEILPLKTFLSTNRHSSTTAEDFSKAFQISIE